MRCKSSKNINVKSIYYPLIEHKNNNNSNVSNDCSQNAIYIDKDNYITSKYHKFDNFFINSLKNLSKIEYISKYNDKILKEYVVIINNHNNNSNNDLMLNDKGTLIHSFFKK
jgi:hypothetical protein